jgi:integrase
MPKKNKTRHPKGSVAVKDRNGRLFLHWTYEGKRERIAFGLPNTPANRHAAQGLADQIQSDIRLQRYDRTLEKYRPQSKPEVPQNLSTAEAWQRWMDYQRAENSLTGQTLVNRYRSIGNHLKRFGPVPDATAAKAFIDDLRTRQKATTANRYLQMLDSFGEWATAKGLMDSNFFAHIKPLKDSAPRTQRREPFSHEEIDLILRTFKTHRVYWRYHDFVLTLFCLGLRPSEAIGLCWKHVDFDQKTIAIAESLSRGEDGRSSGHARERRIRKTHNLTILDLPDVMIAMLEGRRGPAAKPDELIFTSVTGKPIDDHTFSQREWRTVLEAAGVRHRPPNTCRHSVASHAIAQGASLPQVAYLLGHKDTRMVASVYGHMINRPQLPKMGT